MADRRSLRLIGFLYGGVTALVMTVACLVVGDHISGRLSLDGKGPDITPVVRMSAAIR